MLLKTQITNVSIVCSTICSSADQRKHQSSTSLDFRRGIHWSLVDSPHKGPVTWKMFPFDDIIMYVMLTLSLYSLGISSIGNHGVAGGISECRLSSCSSFLCILSSVFSLCWYHFHTQVVIPDKSYIFHVVHISPSNTIRLLSVFPLVLF